MMTEMVSLIIARILHSLLLKFLTTQYVSLLLNLFTTQYVSLLLNLLSTQYVSLLLHFLLHFQI